MKANAWQCQHPWHTGRYCRPTNVRIMTDIVSRVWPCVAALRSAAISASYRASRLLDLVVVVWCICGTDLLMNSDHRTKTRPVWLDLVYWVIGHHRKCHTAVQSVIAVCFLVFLCIRPTRSAELGKDFWSKAFVWNAPAQLQIHKGVEGTEGTWPQTQCNFFQTKMNIQFSTVLVNWLIVSEYTPKCTIPS